MEIQLKYSVFDVFVFSENNIWPHLARDLKRVQIGFPWALGPKGPPLGPKGPPWAQRVHLEAEGRLKGPWALLGTLAAIPIGGAIGTQSDTMASSRLLPTKQSVC